MKVFTTILAFIFAAVLASVALAFASSGLNAFVSSLALLAGAAVAVVTWRSIADEEKPRLGGWDWAMLAIFALASLRAFIWLVYQREDEIRVLSPNNLGDMSLHFNYIRYLASGVPFWPENPILTGAPLTYPLGVDIFNSLLELSGVETIPGLVWMGLLGAGLAGYALWRWGGAFGMAAFLFNGGLTGFALLQSGVIDDFQRELVWKNIFLSMFVTQRGLLLALPAGLFLLTVWRERFFRSGRQIVPVWLQLLFYAAMPMFNVHAFLFLSVILLAIFVAAQRSRKELFVFVGMAFVPATTCVVLVTGWFSASSNVRWLPAWIMQGRGPMEWVWNFGLTIPLCLVLAGLLVRGKDPEARCFVWTSVLLFAGCCLFALAPWEWDNMKLMIWSWLVIAPYLWTKLLAPLHVAGRSALCFALFFSGAVSLVGGLDSRQGYTIAKRSELDAWQAAVADIPPTERFACVSNDNSYNHPLILLGRKVACGYPGHLWSHGLKYSDKLDLLKSALDGRKDWKDAAPVLDVQWLAIRNSDYGEVRPPGLLPSAGFGALYDLRPLTTPDSGSQAPQQLPPRSVDLSW